MNDHQMRQTLELALKDRAPKAYRQMKNRGQLATYLGDLTAQAMQSISTATEQAIPGLMQTADPVKRVQQAEMARKTAEEVALSQALETMPMEQTEDEAEPDEPMSLYDLTGDHWREKMQRETAAPPARRATTASSREN